MILDHLDHWRQLFRGPAWSKAFHELARAAADPAAFAVGDHAIEGSDIVLKVMTYNTKARAEGTLETHRDFIDIQAVLSGAEALEWYPIHSLTEKTAYDPTRDATFYQIPAAPAARFDFTPGLFCVLFPRDGHLASLHGPAGPTEVKKAVIKLRASLVEDPFTWR